MGSSIPHDILPSVHIAINDYLAFDLNFATITAGLFLSYYYALEPLAAVGPPPQPCGLF